jgi:hypothetical protein
VSRLECEASYGTSWSGAGHREYRAEFLRCSSSFGCAAALGGAPCTWQSAWTDKNNKGIDAQQDAHNDISQTAIKEISNQRCFMAAGGVAVRTRERVVGTTFKTAQIWQGGKTALYLPHNYGLSNQHRKAELGAARGLLRTGNLRRRLIYHTFIVHFRFFSCFVLIHRHQPAFGLIVEVSSQSGSDCPLASRDSRCPFQ